jgi:hypothetical protein
MVRSILILLVLANLFSCNSISKSSYKVLSIDSISTLKFYYITVEKENKKLLVLSNSDSIKSLTSVYNYSFISVGSKLKMELKEFNDSNNPFTPMVEINRRGSSRIYVDGKLLYNPKEPLYYSNCIKGLYYIKGCK